jgi:hypothetical protein
MNIFPPANALDEQPVNDQWCLVSFLILIIAYEKSAAKSTNDQVNGPENGGF